MAPHMHPDDPSRMAVPYPYMPMNSNGVMAGHMFNWGGGGAGGWTDHVVFKPDVRPG